MSALLAALLAAAHPAPPPGRAASGTAWVFSTVGQSEWCPAGNVTLDLNTGRYVFTPTAPRPVCGRAGLERPVRKGRLAGRSLAAVRAAYRDVLSEGAESRSCRENRPPDRLILSNGGLHILVVTDGRESLSAPDDLSCWSDAAIHLHHLLEQTFRS